MTTTKPGACTEAEAYLAAAKRLLQSLNDGPRISNGLNAGGGLTEDNQLVTPIPAARGRRAGLVRREAKRTRSR